MVKSKPKTIDEIFSKIEPEQKAIAERLRVLVKATVVKAVETVRRGRITYTLGGKDFAGIRLTKQHVDLLFCEGERLSSVLLKGKGSIIDPRHIEVTALKNFDEVEAKRLLREAAAIAQA
jgi:hypothetical protein